MRWAHHPVHPADERALLGEEGTLSLNSVFLNHQGTCFLPLYLLCLSGLSCLVLSTCEVLRMNVQT